MPSQSNPSKNTKQNLIALSGNTVRIYFGGSPVGYLQNFSGQNDYGQQPLSGIGDAHVQEYVPGLSMHTLTADRAVIRRKSIYNILAGDEAQNGNPSDFFNMDGLLKGYVFDVVVIEPASTAALPTDASSGSAPQQFQNGSIVRWWRSCSIGADSMQIQKNAIIYTNLTIHALDVYGELHGSDADAINDMDKEPTTSGPSA